MEGRYASQVRSLGAQISCSGPLGDGPSDEIGLAAFPRHLDPAEKGGVALWLPGSIPPVGSWLPGFPRPGGILTTLFPGLAMSGSDTEFGIPRFQWRNAVFLRRHALLSRPLLPVGPDVWLSPARMMDQILLIVVRG